MAIMTGSSGKIYFQLQRISRCLARVKQNGGRGAIFPRSAQSMCKIIVTLCLFRLPFDRSPVIIRSVILNFRKETDCAVAAVFAGLSVCGLRDYPRAAACAAPPGSRLAGAEPWLAAADVTARIAGLCRALFAAGAYAGADSAGWDNCRRVGYAR